MHEAGAFGGDEQVWLRKRPLGLGAHSMLARGPSAQASRSATPSLTVTVALLDAKKVKAKAAWRWPAAFADGTAALTRQLRPGLRRLAAATSLNVPGLWH